MALTDKQAKALDALRHGGTIADVAERLGSTYAMAGRVVDALVRKCLVEAGWKLTDSGRAAHLESLK